METKWKALAQNVIAVASPRYGNRWKAYIAAVPGVSHRDEWQAVADNGHILDEAVARAIFPDFKDCIYGA